LTDEQAIRDLVARWHQATKAGDLAQILPLMAEDVIFLAPGQPPLRGKEAFAAGFQAAFQKAGIESKGDVKEVRVSGDLAYCWTHLSVTMIPRDSGDAVHRTGPALTILRKDADGRWVLFRDANMLFIEQRSRR
jgi:uncharacterized protein (TIGR02246 family)